MSLPPESGSGTCATIQPQAPSRERKLRIVLRITVAADRIAAIEAVADPQRLGEFDVVILDA